MATSASAVVSYNATTDSVDFGPAAGPLQVLSHFAILALPHAIFFFCAWRLFARVLFPAYRVQEHRGVPIMFSLTVMACMSMFQLLLFEVLGVLHFTSRFLNWKLNLYILIVLLVAVIPARL